MYEYPFGNGQQLNLDWFLNEWKNLLAAWEAEKNGIEGALQAEIDRAEAALADVFAARDVAAQSAANALESKNAAAQSASDASGYLATVRADANTASNAARNAAQSESNAAESAQTALASKNTAVNSERNAAQSEANANSSKNAAAQSAADALAHKDAAAQSAADADASKSAAAQSAEDAENAAESVEASAQKITTNTSNIEAISAEETTTPEQLGLSTSLDDTGKISTSTDNRYRVYYCPVIKGAKYKLISHDISGSSVYAFYINKPKLNSRSYNNNRIVTQSNEFISPIMGYIAFRSNSTQTDECITNRIAIDSIARNLINLIAKELPQMIADTALTPNDFRIVDNVLYRITTAIASGGTLTVGTNVVETTVADVLKSLLN